jgi:phosphate transport system substrate-binding protein
MSRILPIALLSLLVAAGCGKRPDSYTTGHRTVLIADPYLPLLQREADEFMSLYPQAKTDVHGTSTRGAIVSLLNDSVYSIVIDRPLNEEERRVAQQAEKRIVLNKIGEDGIAVIVNASNRIANIDSISIHEILARSVQNWQEISGSRESGPIDVVLTGRNSGMYELLLDRFFTSTKLVEPTTVVASQEEAIRTVSLHPHAIGFVASSLVMNGPQKVRVVPVLVRSPQGEKSECLPGQLEIYQSLYPFHYSLYLCNAEAKAAVGIGFGAFLVSNEGQKVIQKAGMAPAAIPYRTIQLTSE